MVTAAAKVFKHYGISQRVQVIGGDFFKELPKNGDLYILCRVLLNWDDNDAKKIISNCCRQMQLGTTLIIADFLMPEKNHPTYKHVTNSDLNLLACVNSAIRTKKEWLQLIKGTGFKFKRFYVNTNYKNATLISPMFVLEAVAT